MFSIGVDLGGTNIAAGLVDRSGRIVRKLSVKTGAHRPPGDILADMADCCRRLIVDGEPPSDRIKAVGIAAPGLINSRQGAVISSANLPFEDYPLAEQMSMALGLPVFIANDASCAALGEYLCGAGTGHRNILLLTIGTGIGGGLIVDGKLYEGSLGLGGEIGHMVIEPDGLLCGCGRRGCAEMYLSARALGEQAKEAARQSPDSLMLSLAEGEMSGISARTPFIAARQGDKTAAGVLDRYTLRMARLLLDQIYLLRPDIILIGGGMSAEGEGLFGPLREKVGQLAAESIYGIHLPPIRAASLKNDAGIIGAAAITWGSAATHTIGEGNEAL